MLLICTNPQCLTMHSVGSPCCPQCGGTDRVEQGSPEHSALRLADAAGPAPADEPVGGGKKGRP